MNRRQATRAERWRWPVLWLWLALLLVPAAAQAETERLPGAAQAPTERQTGDWQQFVLVEGAWRALGIYRVEQADGEYRMTPLDQSHDPGVTPSKGLSNVRFSGGDWTFDSDWGDGKVGEFRLRHIGPGTYAGWSYLRDERVNMNLWLLVR